MSNERELKVISLSMDKTIHTALKKVARKRRISVTGLIKSCMFLDPDVSFAIDELDAMADRDR